MKLAIVNFINKPLLRPRSYLMQCNKHGYLKLRVGRLQASPCNIVDQNHVGCCRCRLVNSLGLVNYLLVSQKAEMYCYSFNQACWARPDQQIGLLDIEQTYNCSTKLYYKCTTNCLILEKRKKFKKLFANNILSRLSYRV